ncbi:MAG: aspartate/glutamate racemase family protein [Caldimonas sp.]
MSAAPLGVLMLDTRFPRPPGDIGNPHGLPWPVLYRTVAGAWPRRVLAGNDPALLKPFIDAARALVRDGAGAVATSCGFLIRLQRELVSAVSVPVWTSSLLKLPELTGAGVLTVDAASLLGADLLAAGAAIDTPVEGLASGCHLQRVLLDDLPELDLATAEQDAVAAALRLVARCPGVTSLVLECTNLPPYAEAIVRATRRPVHHLASFIAERFGSAP